MIQIVFSIITSSHKSKIVHIYIIYGQLDELLSLLKCLDINHMHQIHAWEVIHPNLHHIKMKKKMKKKNHHLLHLFILPILMILNKPTFIRIPTAKILSTYNKRAFVPLCITIITIIIKIHFHHNHHNHHQNSRSSS